MGNIKGFVYGILTAVTFGLIPLFTLPLMTHGMEFDSILFWRFLIATLALGGLMLFKGESFRITARDIPGLVLAGFLYTMSAMFLFWSYKFMAAGIATTLHFTYPIFVTLVMWIFFREKTSAITLGAIALAIGGVATLSINGDDMEFSFLGLVIVLLSAVGYGLYITTLHTSSVKTMPSRKLAFYVFIVSTILFAAKAMTNGGIQAVPDPVSMLNIFLLAVVPTIISNLTLVMAVHHIGGTLTAVLGAMEPITAVCVGVLVFGEPFTPNLAVGIVMIITAVTAIILSRQLQEALNGFLHRRGIIRGK